MTLLIAALSAVLTGMVAFRFFLWLQRLAAQTAAGRVGKPPLEIEKQLNRVLRHVSVPAALRRRWISARLADRLTQAGLTWSGDDFAALRWLSLWLGLGAGLGVAAWSSWSLSGESLGAICLAAGWWGPEAWLVRKVEHRQREMDLALPNFLDRLALGMEAGLGFHVALERSAFGFPGGLGVELRRTLGHLERGHPRGEALDSLAARVPSQDLRSFVAAVKQSDRLGTSLAKTLRIQTRLMRARRRRKAQEASRRLPILIVFPLVLLFLPSLLIIYLAPPLLHLFLGR